jgi:RNA polymerase sigma-70 factor, ECF subfamily
VAGPAADANQAAIRDPRCWLITVVGRLCLNGLRSAAVHRERYVGPWLLEPLVTQLDSPVDPLDEVVRDDGVRMAALVVLERLTPEQQVAFVLHGAPSRRPTAGPGGPGRAAPGARSVSRRASQR